MDREDAHTGGGPGREEDPVDRTLSPLPSASWWPNRGRAEQSGPERGGDERPASGAAGSSFPGRRVLRPGPGDTPRAHRSVAARPVQSRRSRAVSGHPCLCNVPVRPARQLSKTPARPPSPVLCPAAQPPSPAFWVSARHHADVGLGAPLFPGQPHRPLRPAAGSCATEAAGVPKHFRGGQHMCPRRPAGGRCCVPAEGPRAPLRG